MVTRRPCDVLVHVEDPGAANLVTDIEQDLARQGIHALLVAEGLGRSHLDRLARSSASREDADAATLLARHSPRLVVVGTSDNADGFGRALVREARAAGIGTIAVIDMAFNAERRFRGRSGRPLDDAPDAIAAADDDVLSAFVGLGFPQACITVVGNPHFDRAIAWRDANAAMDPLDFRARLLPDVGRDRKLVLFMSEARFRLNPEDSTRSPAYSLAGRGGNDFRSAIVLEEILDAAHVSRHRPGVILRPHPANDPQEFDRYRDELVTTMTGPELWPLMRSVDLVVGMTSIVLTEAMLIGCRVLSVVPRAREESWIQPPARGCIACVSSRATLRQALEVLLDPSAPTPNSLPSPRARERLAAMIASRLRHVQFRQVALP
jgi:hypothetical protein